MIITDLSTIEEIPLGKSKDLSKETYEHFKAIKRIKPYTNSRHAHWLCLCECGQYFTSTSGHLNAGSCKSCGHLQKDKASQVLKKYLEDNKGKPRVDYVGYKSGKLTVISFSHINKNHRSVWNCQCECGNIKQTASSELAKKETKSCGCLNQSYGSYKIEQILLKNNIPFEKEKTFETCRFPNSNALARFDFFVNGILIEFDGKQHYEYVGGYFTYNDFQNLQKRDEYKNKWCKENNIPLIRIPYFDEDKITDTYIMEVIKNENKRNSLFALQKCWQL